MGQLPKGMNDIFPAAMTGKTERVRELLDAGVQPNHVAVSLFGLKTPLHFSSEEGHVAIVRLLLERSANCDPLDEMGATPLMYAMMNGHADVIRELVEHGASIHIQGPGEATPMDFAQAAVSEGKLELDVLVWLRKNEQNSRLSRGHCVMCGKPLGPLEKLRKRVQHSSCATYTD